LCLWKLHIGLEFRATLQSSFGPKGHFVSV
jgi:hypothetical protein